jgi:hypothetical protein
VALWVGVLTSAQQADVSVTDASEAVCRLLGERNPKDIYPALVIQGARSISKSRAPSTWQTFEEKLALEAPEKRRQRLQLEDRTALANLARAFANAKQMKAFDHLAGTLQSCGVEFSAREELDDDTEIPF